MNIKKIENKLSILCVSVCVHGVRVNRYILQIKLICHTIHLHQNNLHITIVKLKIKIFKFSIL